MPSYGNSQPLSLGGNQPWASGSRPSSDSLNRDEDRGYYWSNTSSYRNEPSSSGEWSRNSERQQPLLPPSQLGRNWNPLPQPSSSSNWSRPLGNEEGSLPPRGSSPLPSWQSGPQRGPQPQPWNPQPQPWNPQPQPWNLVSNQQNWSGPQQPQPWSQSLPSERQWSSQPPSRSWGGNVEQDNWQNSPSSGPWQAPQSQPQRYN